MKDMYLAAVDIGGTKILAAIFDQKGILCRVYQPAKKQGNNKTIPKQVDSLIGFLCKKIDIKKKDISALGISTCSPFEKIGKFKAVFAANLCGGISRSVPNNWKYIPLEKELSKTYKHIDILNDGTAAVIAEGLFGNLKNKNSIVYVTWSTGIGTGAYVTGIDAYTSKPSIFLLTGKNNNAPHGGHIYLSDKKTVCNCGQKGDFESLASGTAIEKMYGKPSKQAFADYRKGNKKAKKVIEQAAKHFARGLASINAILDIDMFIIGGSVMKNKDILLPLVKKEFYRSFKPLTKDVEITASTLNDYICELAAIVTLLPNEWIRPWQKNKPWKKAPKTIFLD